MLSTLPNNVADFVRAEFQGETIRWSGQPDPARACLGAMPMLLFGIPWTAFSVFWMWAAWWGSSKASGDASWFALFPLFGVPFVLIGVGMLAAPVWKMLLARRTVYVLTAKRLTVVESGLTLKVRSIFPGDVHSIERTQRTDGSGNLKIVTGWTKDSEGGQVEKSETLFGVPGVRQVEDQIRGVFELAAGPSSAKG
jgi:hypothetical protein